VHEFKESRLIEVFNGDFGRFMKAESLALAALRKAIITGALPPGQSIDEEMVASHLNISRMPVRQAMGVLESEGLVNRVYKRGVTVTELSANEITEIYHMRANLEGLAVRQAVPNYTDAHIERTRSALQQLEDHYHDIDAFIDLNTEFHSLLYEPSEWDRLCTLIVALRNNVSRYVAISHHFIAQLHHVGADHRRIFQACENRDADLAEELVKQHVFNAMNILLKTFETNAWTSSSLTG
jgi:DNA-binding GntR family transcriptional regulator